MPGGAGGVHSEDWQWWRASPPMPGGRWQILNSAVSTAVPVSSVCQNPCPACMWDMNTLGPGLEFSRLQMVFAFYWFLPGAESSRAARGNCYGHFQRALEKESVLENRGERKPRCYLLARGLTWVYVATKASMKLGAPGRVLKTNSKYLLLLEGGCYACSRLCTLRKPSGKLNLYPTIVWKLYKS